MFFKFTIICYGHFHICIKPLYFFNPPPHPKLMYLLLTNSLGSQLNPGIILRSDNFNLNIRAGHALFAFAKMPSADHPDGNGHGLNVDKRVLVIGIEPVPEHEAGLEQVPAGPVVPKLGLVEYHRLVARLKIEGYHLGARVPKVYGTVVGGVDALAFRIHARKLNLPKKDLHNNK